MQLTRKVKTTTWKETDKRIFLLPYAIFSVYAQMKNIIKCKVMVPYTEFVISVFCTSALRFNKNMIICVL